MNVVYFAWVRERIGLPKETVQWLACAKLRSSRQ